jgi:hypothetical protein
MRARRSVGTIWSMIETATSVTVIHGAMLSFETVEARGADDAPVRLREQHATLLRVIDGMVTLEVDGSTRTLQLEGEAWIGAGVPHRLWGDARIVQEFRAAV